MLLSVFTSSFSVLACSHVLINTELIDQLRLMRMSLLFDSYYFVGQL